MRGSFVSSVVALGLASLIALTSTLPASAAVGEWSTPVTLSAAGQDASDPQLVTDGSTMAVIWYRSDGINNRVQVASSTNGGLTWSTPVTVSAAGQNASSPKLVTDGTTITAAWRRNDGSNTRVQVASSSNGGLTWSTPVTISEAGQNASAPWLVTDGTTITVTWVRSDGSNSRAQVASSTNGGLTWSTPVTLSEGGGDAAYPQLVTDGTTITAAWFRRYDGVNNSVQVASSTNGGLTWSTPVTLSAPAADAFNQHLVTDGSTITVAWVQRDGGSTRIQVASSTNGGLTWSIPVALSDSGGDSTRPRLVTDGSTITAVWSRFDGSHARVQVASSTNGGVTWGIPVTVSEAGGTAYEPKAVTDGSTITVAWHRSDSDDSDNFRVQVASSVDGGLTWSTPVTLSEAGQDTYAPQLEAGGATVTAVWASYDGINEMVKVASTPIPVDEPAGPELAATGATEALALGLVAGGLLLAGGVLVVARVRGRRTA